jgi:uncharacterized membrane protein
VLASLIDCTCLCDNTIQEMVRLHIISVAFSVHSHCLPIGIFSLHQFMQYELESIRKRFATVVPVLAALGVVAPVLECSGFQLIQLTIMNSSSINEMLFLTWSGSSV